MSMSGLGGIMPNLASGGAPVGSHSMEMFAAPAASGGAAGAMGGNQMQSLMQLLMKQSQPQMAQQGQQQPPTPTAPQLQQGGNSAAQLQAVMQMLMPKPQAAPPGTAMPEPDQQFLNAPPQISAPQMPPSQPPAPGMNPIAPDLLQQLQRIWGRGSSLNQG